MHSLSWWVGLSLGWHIAWVQQWQLKIVRFIEQCDRCTPHRAKCDSVLLITMADSKFSVIHLNKATTVVVIAIVGAYILAHQLPMPLRNGKAFHWFCWVCTAKLCTLRSGLAHVLYSWSHSWPKENLSCHQYVCHCVHMLGMNYLCKLAGIMHWRSL